MGVAGDSVALTPNLDRLARESVRFTSAYCTNPVCAPSRASILTGLWTHNLEATDNAKPYSHRHKTIADQFKAAGYMTSLVGKMHFVDAQTHGFDYKLEFNDWWQYLGPKTQIWADELGRPNSGSGLPQINSLWQKGDPWAGHRKTDGRLVTVAVGRASEMVEEDHFESFVARESIRFFEDHGKSDEPFLLISSFLKPHDPFTPAKRFADLFKADDMQLSPSWGKAETKNLPAEVREAIEVCRWTPELKHAAEARQRVASNYACLAQVDDCAGQILDALNLLGLDQNTLIIYTSDHGEMLGDLGLWNKFQFYEGSCGVPLMFKGPSIVASECLAPVSLISLKSTLAELCDVSLLGRSDGESFANWVRHPTSGQPHLPVFAEYKVGTRDAKYMIRDGKYKYIFWVNDKPELYDLSRDPQELRNVANDPQYQPVARELRQELFKWHTPQETSV